MRRNTQCPNLRRLFLELTPLLGHGALEPYLEAYRIVAEQLLQYDSAADFKVLADRLDELEEAVTTTGSSHRLFYNAVPPSGVVLRPHACSRAPPPSSPLSTTL